MRRFLNWGELEGLAAQISGLTHIHSRFPLLIFEHGPRFPLLNLERGDHLFDAAFLGGEHLVELLLVVQVALTEDRSGLFDQIRAARPKSVKDHHGKKKDGALLQ